MNITEHDGKDQVEYCERGETLTDRIRRIAVEEIRLSVVYNNIPITVHEHMLPTEGYKYKSLSGIERSHNISFFYECFVLGDYVIDNNVKQENDDRFLKWFDSIPNDILEFHIRVYGDILEGIQ